MAANLIIELGRCALLALAGSVLLAGCATEHHVPAWHQATKHAPGQHGANAGPAVGLAAGATAAVLPEGATPVRDSKAGAHPVPPPPFTEGIFPCSDCHEDQDTDRTRRELTEEHEDIVIQHGSRDRWCFDCHNPNDRDKLRLASGRLVEFDVSYRLCGQCHGPKLRDWHAGVHGKRTGQWNGRKQYLLCVHCHDPHSPRFKPLKPSPRPLRPAEISVSPAK